MTAWQLWRPFTLMLTFGMAGGWWWRVATQGHGDLSGAGTVTGIIVGGAVAIAWAALETR